jgi:Tol biopolymer transport system component
MRLDERARLAVDDIQLAVDQLERETRGPLERFDRYRERRQRNRRLTAGVLAAIVALGALLFALRALQPDRSVPATPVVPTGTLLFGDRDPKTQEATWSTVSADGSHRTDLGFQATCARWSPTGDQILITNDGPSQRTGGPLRPAIVQPDGTGRVSLDGLTDPGLNLGCGDMSPDGSLLVAEGWVNHTPSRSGIYEVRASDGSGLIRLTEGHDSAPVYAPDGTQVAFFRTKVGISPDGAGAVFVVNTNGTGLRRVTPWGWAFLFESWSPDGQWIAFQKPYGQVYLVHPDGSDLHQVPLALPAGMGALNPEWSPDGQWLVFSAQNGDESTIWVSRPDGSGLQQITEQSGMQDTQPDWRP